MPASSRAPENPTFKERRARIQMRYCDTQTRLPLRIRYGRNQSNAPLDHERQFDGFKAFERQTAEDRVSPIFRFVAAVASVTHRWNVIHPPAKSPRNIFYVHSRRRRHNSPRNRHVAGKRYLGAPSETLLEKKDDVRPGET